MKHCNIISMDEKSFFKHHKLHRRRVFSGQNSYSSNKQFLSEDEAALAARFDGIYRLFLGVFDDQNEFIGWSWGHQVYEERPLNYPMKNSAVLALYNSVVPALYRRRGIYRALIKKTIEIVTAEGFQSITSRHHSTNNAVIIPKLQEGFFISKIEISASFGALVHLSYEHQDLRRKMLRYRSGEIQADEEIEKILGKCPKSWVE